MTKKEVFIKESEVEARGLRNLSVGTQKLQKIELVGGKYGGIVTEVPELKAKGMVDNGKAKYAAPKAKVIPTELHELEARNIADKKKKDGKDEAEK